MILMGIYQISAGSSTRQVFLTGGSCAKIPGVGSPILMLANAHKYIEDALHVKNDYTVVKYIHFSSIPSATVPGQVTYKLVFSITDYNGTKYLGLEVLVSPFGIGSVRIVKFLLTKSIDAIKNAIDSTVDESNTFQCGDLKFVYSSFGNDPTAKLKYLHPGRNQNSAKLALLNQLNKTTAKDVKRRVCANINYVETANFYEGEFGVGPNGPDDLLNCLPDQPAVAAIHVGCFNDALTSFQLTFNNFNGPGTTTSPIVGDATTPASDITSISLVGVDRVSFTRTTNPDSLAIQTLDENNNVLDNFECGAGATDPETVIVTVDDFLGITSITHDGNLISSFEITQYNSS